MIKSLDYAAEQEIKWVLKESDHCGDNKVGFQCRSSFHSTDFMFPIFNMGLSVRVCAFAYAIEHQKMMS